MSHPPLGPALPLSVATLGIATFAGMDVLMKLLAIEIGAYNAMLWRTLLALIIATVLFLWSRGRWPEKSVFRLHVWRGVVTSAMAFLFFWGLIYVPLAEAVGLSFIAPLLALYLAAVFLKESVGSKAVWASVIGLAGAVVIIGGKLGGEYSEAIGRGIAAILLSALLYAYNLILQRRQAVVAKPVEIVFFQNATVVTVYLLFFPLLAVTPGSELLPYLIASAALAVVSSLLLSWAYARAEARILIPVEYTAFVWAALFGWLVFGEEITTATLLGTVLIVVGCLMTANQKPERMEHIETTAI
ncbi:MAG: S-adenosylmethionine uptake transporter [Halieaceae bacterium]|jgi:S-adenosylmethionine uptake transporter